MRFKEINNLIGVRNLYNMETRTRVYLKDFAKDDFSVEFVKDDFNNNRWVVLLSFSEAIEEMKSGKTIKRLEPGGPKYNMSIYDETNNSVHFSFREKDIVMQDWVAFE